LLMLGNAPRVTNSTVSGLKGSNLPEKQNFLGLRGLGLRLEAYHWLTGFVCAASHSTLLTFFTSCLR